MPDLFDNQMEPIDQLHDMRVPLHHGERPFDKWILVSHEGIVYRNNGIPVVEDDEQQARQEAIDDHRVRMANYFAAIANGELDADTDPDPIDEVMRCRVEPDGSVTLEDGTIIPVE